MNEEHDHDHGHEHEHSHNHSHEHGGSHESAAPAEGKEMETLKALVGHWAEHNDSHVESYSEWAQRAEEKGKAETAALLRQAVEYTNKVTEALKLADEKLIL